MKPSEILHDEHEKILQVFALITTGLRKFKNKEIVPSIFWEDIFVFINNYVNENHNKKEELFFLRKVKDKNSEKYSAYADVVAAEHRLGRKYLKEIEFAVDDFYDGNDMAIYTIENNLQDYMAMMRHHIDKENIYYPMIENELLSEELEKIVKQFLKIENGVLGIGGENQYAKAINQYRLELEADY